MSCGYPDCKAVTKQFGVCNRHKRWAFTTEDCEFFHNLNIYRQILLSITKLDKRLQSRVDDNALGLSGSLHGDIQQLSELLQAIKSIRLTLQRKYGIYLAYNVAIREEHSLNSSCNCKICSLGKK